MRALGMPPVSGGTPQYRSEGPTLLDRRAGARPTQARRNNLNHREKFVQGGGPIGTYRTATRMKLMEKIQGYCGLGWTDPALALSHERPFSRAWRPELREFGKALAASLPIRWAEGIADYAVMRNRLDLLPPEYIIRDRAAYFARIATLLGGPEVPLTFLEFGVYQGDSLRRWLALNRHPDSRFLGFDSFTGLPARWRSRPAGYFDCGGEVPAITDPRVSFVPGWFNQTLPGTLTKLPPASPARKLLVHIDADLHASALYCLVHRFHETAPLCSIPRVTPDAVG